MSNSAPPPGQSSACRQVRQALGAYVLAGLDPDEQEHVRAHLDGCAQCRTEYAELAQVPGSLALLPGEQAIDAAGGTAGGDPEGTATGERSEEATDDPGLTTTLDRLRAERARLHRRNRMWLAAAVVLLVLVGVGAWVGSRWAVPDSTGQYTAAPVAEPSQWSTVDERTSVDATVTMNPVAWGTRMDVVLHGVARGTTCRLVVVTTDGQTWTAGSWQVAYDSGVWWSGGVGVQAEQVREVRVYAVDGDNRPLVTLPG